MIQRFKSALHRAVNQLLPGESGWVNLSNAMPWSASGVTSKAGKVVSATTAMQISTVWDCVKKTSQLISTLPLALYERGQDGEKIRIEDDLSEILTQSPNRDQTAVEYWEAKVAHTVLRGNAYSEKLFVGSRLVGLRQLFNACPERTRDAELKYAVIDRGKKYYLPTDKVFHLRGFGGGDGIGMSAIRYGANSMGAALAADETASKVFSNQMMASGVLSSDQTLSETQRAQLAGIMESYVGSERAGKILTLEAGLKFQQLQMNPEDAQLLDTRRFNVEDVCRWFGVPPIVVGHAAQGQTMWGSGVEAIMLAWLTLGINPLLRKIEARVRKDLIPVQNRKRRFIEFNREAMLQMDSKAKGDFLLKMRMGGFMSGDEGRDKLNLPRRGGQNDELVIQTSMTLVDLLGKDDK